MANKPLGRFTWHEVMTADVDGARAFYPRIAGWSMSVWDGASGPYEMWMNGETPVGGLMDLPSPNVPPCWLAYVSTPDLDATLAKARELGGTALNVMTVPEVGSFAVIEDPQGGYIAVLEPEGDAAGHDGMPELGEFSWHELATTGPEAAWAFYSQVFGWRETSRMDMGEAGEYLMFGRGAHPEGGIYKVHGGMPPGWLNYIRVADARAAAETVAEAGGKVVNGPIEVPGGDFVAQCLDPSGIPFAVHSVSG